MGRFSEQVDLDNGDTINKETKKELQNNSGKKYKFH